jgi:nitrite reductase/ring-hydroxylating ferredoxin subunit
VKAPPAGAQTKSAWARNDAEGNLPAWAYSDTALLALEREALFKPSWQLVGHEADIPKQGDYITADLAGERVLVMRTRPRDIRAFRNACRRRPHALVTGGARGHFSSTIACNVHGLVYELDGRLRSGDTPGDLVALELALPGRFMLVRTAVAEPSAGAAASAGGGAVTSLLEIAGAPTGDWESLPDLRPAGLAEIAVAADWKLVVEQWLDAPARPSGTERTFLPPNQILERSANGALLLQVIPQSPGRCVIRRLDYSVARKAGAARKRGSTLGWLQQDIEVAESTQAALAAGIEEADGAAPVSGRLAQFRRDISVLLRLVRTNT